MHESSKPLDSWDGHTTNYLINDTLTCPSSAFLHTKKMFYDILNPVPCLKHFLTKNKGINANKTTESLFFAERKKPPG